MVIQDYASKVITMCSHAISAAFL